MSLSSRFAKISAIKAAPVASTENRTVKRNVVAAAQKNKRADAVQAKRGLPVNPVAKKPSTAPNVVKGKKVIIKGKGGKKIGGKKPVGGRGRGKGRDKKEPVKAEDLDRELGLYLHKAGKGPNPLEAELDDMLDNYKKSKTESK